MRQAGFSDHPFGPEEMNDFIRTAMEHGAVFFDHADIYGLGRAGIARGTCMGTQFERMEFVS